MTSDSTTERLVWDLPLRVFHWLLVVSLAASWLTAEIGYDVRQYHMWLGYWMIGLIAFRLVWGVVGPRHARFASFLPTPRALMTHLREARSGGVRPTAGHNPAGSLMIVALLVLLAVQATSGLFMDDDIYYAGPYAYESSEAVRDTMSTIHHNALNFILALVALHIIAVVYFSVFRKHRLIRAMLTGRKSTDVVAAEDEIKSSRLALALALIVAIGAGIYSLGWI